MWLNCRFIVYSGVIIHISNEYCFINNELKKIFCNFLLVILLKDSMIKQQKIELNFLRPCMYAANSVISTVVVNYILTFF